MKKVKKMLTIEDLINFCSSNNMYNFKAEQTGRAIVVQSVQDTPISFSDVSEKEGLLFAKVKTCHILDNRNQSYISEDSMKVAMPSLKYRPLLGTIHQLDDGSYDFHSHDTHIEKDKDGKDITVYDEQQLGTFTNEDPYLEYDKDMNKTYVVANAVIPEEYSLAADIIRNKKESKVSCELVVYECSYNAKEKKLELINFRFNGVCLLGSEKDGTTIGEGMIGSKLTLEDFSAENNSLFNVKEYEKKMFELQAKVEKLEACFNNKKLTEGGKEGNMKLEQLLKKYGKTVKDLTFDYENMSEEDLETKFSELFEGEDDDSDSEPTETETETDPKDEAEDSTIEDETDISSDTSDSNKKKKYTVNEDGTATISYDLSHDEIRESLYKLIEQYDELDSDCYGIREVYDDHFIMVSYRTNKLYCQKYIKENDNISLVDERYAVFVDYLTETEKMELETMRSNYAELIQFKENSVNAELKQKKEQIFEDAAYEPLKDTNDFKKLVLESKNFSVEEIQNKVDLMLAKYVKDHGIFEYHNQDKLKKKNKVIYGSVVIEETANGRYGDFIKK